MKKETPKNYKQQANNIYNIGNIQNAKFEDKKAPLPSKLTPIPAPPKYFIGRDEEMQTLQDRLSKEKVLLLVSGMGGIGKTALAQTYAEQHAPNYVHTAWLHYLTDLPQALQSSLKNLPADWQLQEKEPPQEYAQRILHKMANLPGPNLLIIDGWDNEKEINTYREHLNLPNWTLLITTRVQDSLMEQYTIGQLAKDKAIELFLHHAPKAKGDTQVPELLELIGYHTLMIELLAKTYQANIFLDTIADMLKPLKEYDWEDTDLKINVSTDHAKEEVQVYKHLLATFKMAGLTGNEQFILLQFSVLPSVAITAKELFEWLQLKKEHRTEFINLLKSLTQKGWIEKTKTQDYQAHPIIQTALRYQLEPNAQNCYWIIDHFIKQLNIKAHENPLDKAPLIPYALSLLNHINDTHENVATLASNLSRIYNDLGDLPNALAYQQKAMDVRETIFNPKHPDIAQSYNNLSLIYRGLGELPNALVYQQKAMEIWEATFDPQHPSLATSYNNLSLIYRGLGELPNALVYQQKAMEIWEATFDPQHPSLAISYNNLSTIYQSLGELPNALAYQQKAANIWEATLGHHHPYLATSYNNLSTIYQYLGDLLNALAYQQKTIKIKEAIFDPQHPSLAVSYNNLSMIYQSLGDLPNALAYQQKAIEIWEIILGLQDPNLATSYSNLSLIYQSLGDLLNALTYQQKAMEIREATFDPQHPDLAVSYLNMAAIYVHKKKLQIAKGYIDKAVAIFKHNFPNGHPNLTIALEWQVDIDQHLPTK